jgi:hypothetical protein
MGKGNPHLPEKKNIARCYLRAVYEQGGSEGLAKVKPQDCWACHPTELSKGNYNTSAWTSLFGREKKNAEAEVANCGQLSSFPQYTDEQLPDCFKMGGATRGAGTADADNGTGAGAGTNGAGANGAGANGGSPGEKRGKFENCAVVVGRPPESSIGAGSNRPPESSIGWPLFGDLSRTSKCELTPSAFTALVYHMQASIPNSSVLLGLN